ncbi:pentapeptide repeat-containing protein [Streptomyces sp. NBC_00237]|uniref:pentapeptide repeat-containing protein n=1 Tax=Streptomyces sp. NBC_00237 TaxID=2975687 RepID=UPI0022557B02|nr:pentapeptide repeat-containing protein [Streptomyces sp. NBC_00237]MCX5205819.1 pentapeptide repeat-containing protein [Streptomyces sp. NBC_00237]
MTATPKPEFDPKERELRLWKVGRVLGLSFTAAVLIAGALFFGLMMLLKLDIRTVTATKLDARTLFDLVKLSFGVVAGAGALVALVVAYRRQRVDEAGAHREATRLHTERFSTAVDKLGSDSPAVRLGGIHALAGLADDAPTQDLRQTCIDVLCAYLRLPFSPDPGNLPGTPQPYDELRDAHQAKRDQYRALREVRHTILRLIGDHYRIPQNAHRSWQGHDLDLTAVTIDGNMDFTGAVFSSGTVDLTHAVVSGGTVRFNSATFSGGTVRFAGARFFGGTVDLTHAVISSGTMDFAGAVVSGGTVDLTHAVISGGTMNFARATLSSGRVEFGRASFSGGTVRFAGARFFGGTVDLTHAVVSSGTVHFTGAQFSGGTVRFNSATFSGGTVDFNSAMFSGATVRFNSATFSGGTVDFIGATFSRGTVHFIGATFSGATVNFRYTQFSGGIVNFSACSGVAPSGLVPADTSTPLPQRLTLPPAWRQGGTT